MSSYTLLDYLTEPNPELDSDNALKGPPTFHEVRSEIVPVPWTDFTLETLLACYGDVLKRRYKEPFPPCSPTLTSIERDIWDEDSFEHLISRAIVPQVNVSLGFTDNKKSINMTRGGRAKMGATTQEVTDSTQAGDQSSKAKIFPDWAGAAKAKDPQTGYVNRCPGETKLAEKWTSDTDRQKDFYLWPLAQVVIYCVSNWKTRYGYLINQKELVVLRFSKERIGPGIGANRAQRTMTSQQAVPPPVPPSSSAITARVYAFTVTPTYRLARISDYGGTQPTRSYREDSQDLEHQDYQTVEMMSIPWKESGPGKLTVKLALWWIHMLAGAGRDTWIEFDYPPLDSWVHVNGLYQHVSTGKTTDKKPDESKKVRANSARRPSTPRRQRGSNSTFSSPLSSPPSNLGPSPEWSIQQSSARAPSRLTIEDAENAKFDENHGCFVYTVKGGKEERYFNIGTKAYDDRRNVVVYAELRDGRICFRPEPDSRRNSTSSSGSEAERKTRR
ncbi:hypothetical protein AJ79_09261 [Helicocarpus griseus UAMH5409]|uniref:Uncharacterized protein n=1 Tax=Helicocarpus griseus UAMH5409 TaxID=1447875 RepID=A0A2B7WKJ3_9EURO|nr:hypothetical protein AJ79_09261 [Helicocarpus griseus UAMH5409]